MHYRLQLRGPSSLTYERRTRTQTPPASAAWCFNFNLRHNLAFPDTTGFSRVVLQFHPTSRAASRHRCQRLKAEGVFGAVSATAPRLKLNHHAAEAGGVWGRKPRRRLKLKHHTAEAGGVWGRKPRRRLKLKHHAAEAGGVLDGSRDVG